MVKYIHQTQVDMMEKAEDSDFFADGEIERVEFPANMNFRPYNMRGAAFSNCTLDGAEFTGDLFTTYFYECDLSNTRFANCTLNSANMFDCIAQGASFERCRASNLDIRRTDLARSWWIDVEVENAYFYRCCMETANFCGFQARESSFIETTFYGAYLKHVGLARTNILGAEHIIYGGSDMRGYSFYAVNGPMGVMVYAGCRQFHGFGDALHHWNNRHAEIPTLQADCLSLLSRLHHMARMHGWSV